MPFIGEIAELILGGDGLTGTRNQALIAPGQLINARNLTYENGTLQKEGGSVKFTGSAITGTPAILGGIDWHPTTSLQRSVILGDNGKLYRDTGDGSYGTTLKSSLSTPTEIPVFIEAGAEVAANNKKLFICTGTNAIQVISGDATTTADYGTPAADWSGSNHPTAGLIHENKFWAFGNANDPHRAYYSVSTDHEDMTSTGSGSLAIYPGVGEKIVAGISFKGLLVLWKFPKGIFFVDTSNSDITKWRVIKHSSDVGGVSPLGVALTDDDVVFLDHTGSLYSLSAVNAFGDIASANLSRTSDMHVFVRNEVDQSKFSGSQMIYYVDKRQLHITMSSSTNTWNRRLVMDLNRSDKLRFSMSDKDINRSIWLYTDSNGIDRPRTGDNTGDVWNLDQETRSVDGSGFTGLFQSPHLDLSHIDPSLGVRKKNGKFLELVVEPKGNFNLNVDILWDDAISDTLQFNLGSTGATLGTFVLGTDKLAGSNLLSKKHRITGSGRRISLIGRNNGAGQDFSVMKFYLMFTRGNDLAAT